MAFDDRFDPNQFSRLRHRPFALLAEEYADVISGLRALDPIVTASTFSGLLATSELQSNSLRIETLVHLSLALCMGQMAPTRNLVERSFERLGDGHCGRMEDPSEDVFISLVSTQNGNFRIFQGQWEGAGFYLQRILDVVEAMPDRQPFNDVRIAIESLLKLSDAIAERAGVRENVLGSGEPLRVLPATIGNKIPVLREVVGFSETALAQLQITQSSLSKFAFDFDLRASLAAQIAGKYGPGTETDSFS